MAWDQPICYCAFKFILGTFTITLCGIDDRQGMYGKLKKL